MKINLDFLKKNVENVTEDIEAYKAIAKKNYFDNENSSEIMRKAEFLTAFAREMPIVLTDGEPIIGSMRFSRKFLNLNKGHITVDYRMLLREGIAGVKKRISHLKTPDGAAFSVALDAFSEFIARLADAAEGKGLTEPAKNCRKLLSAPPKSFHSALQLVWLVHLFLHAEGSASGVSFGRFDLYMYPFYKRDVELEILAAEDAEKLIGAFFLKCCEADESQNLTVGGDSENELSFLILKVCGELAVKQPSVSVRVGKATSQSFFSAAVKALTVGTGNPCFFNDRVIIPALKRIGIEDADAENYGIVGCYEANPEGCCFGTTSSAGFFYLHDVLTEFLGRVREESYADFSTFLVAFKSFFKKKYNGEILAYLRSDRWEHRVMGECPSPFESLCIGSCLESGVCAEHGGAKYTLAGINILGIGTLTDSLYVIKKLVFELKEYSLSYLVENMSENFSDEALYLKCRNMRGKFGTDDPETNQLVRELSLFISELLDAERLHDGVVSNGGLFVFLHDVDSESYPATPDGRRRGERISYGIAPSDIALGKTLTSVLSSSSNIASDRFANGCPMQIRLSRTELSADNAELILASLIKGYFAHGGFHIQINIADTEELIEAKKNPDLHDDLIVRISGYSDHFTRLREDIQDALIERI